METEAIWLGWERNKGKRISLVVGRFAILIFTFNPNICLWFFIICATNIKLKATELDIKAYDPSALQFLQSKQKILLCIQWLWEWLVNRIRCLAHVQQMANVKTTLAFFIISQRILYMMEFSLLVLCVCFIFTLKFQVKTGRRMWIMSLFPIEYIKYSTNYKLCKEILQC